MLVLSVSDLDNPDREHRLQRQIQSLRVVRTCPGGQIIPECSPERTLWKCSSKPISSTEGKKKPSWLMTAVAQVLGRGRAGTQAAKRLCKSSPLPLQARSTTRCQREKQCSEKTETNRSLSQWAVPAPRSCPSPHRDRSVTVTER